MSTAAKADKNSLLIINDSLLKLNDNLPSNQLYCCLTRFILTVGKSSMGLPSSIRLVTCQVTWSSSALATMLVAVIFFPSGNVVEVLMVSFLPSLDHTPSLNPPVESNDQERICFLLASQPIHCVRPDNSTSLIAVTSEEVIQFWLSVHS